LLHELRLGRESRWYGWLQFVPRDVVRIPALWADEDIGGKGDDGQRGLEWLKGTEALAELEKKDQEGLSLVSWIGAEILLLDAIFWGSELIRPFVDRSTKLLRLSGTTADI
jgi:hypothetical protein